MLKHACQIDALTAQAQVEIGKLAGEERGRPSLGASTTIAQYLLPPLVGKFLSANPVVEPFMFGANTQEVVKALVEKRVDLAFIEGPPERADLKPERFLDDEIVLITHPDNSLQGISDLEQAPIILRERGSGARKVVEIALKKAGLKVSGGLNNPVATSSKPAQKIILLVKMASASQSAGRGRPPSNK